MSDLDPIRRCYAEEFCAGGKLILPLTVLNQPMSCSQPSAVN